MRLLLYISAAVLLHVLEPLQAALQVHDGFQYGPAGTNLLGLNGGFGFTGPWQGASSEWVRTNYHVATPSLESGLLTVSSNRAVTASSDLICALSRTLAEYLGSSGEGTWYLSCLIRPERILNEGAFNGFFGLALATSLNRDLFIGKPSGEAIGRYVMEVRGGQGQVASDSSVILGQTALLVVKLEFRAGADRFTLYVNPVAGLPEPSQGIVKEDEDVGVVFRLMLYSTGAYSVDELRVGTTYEDVTPWVAPLEPVILQQPRDRYTRPGLDVNLDVIVTGAEPLTYQWWFNRTQEIEGATSAALVIPSADAADQGGYSVTVSNAFGMVTSQVAVVMVAESLVVTHVGDEGAGSLRQAMLDANELPGLDRVEFQIPGQPPFRIQPLSALPRLTDPISIDGNTQPGFNGKPVVEINGAMAGSLTFGIEIVGGNSLVRGLVINGFSRSGIILSEPGGSNRVEGNFIGTDVSGTQRVPNGVHGIAFVDSQDNWIGGTHEGAGNLISGNVAAGVRLRGARSTGNRVQGNLIGVDVTGIQPLPNGSGGVLLLGAASNVVGGSTREARNVISGNDLNGVEFQSTTNVCSDNVIEGNYVGTDVTGTRSMPNRFSGVALFGGATRNTIRGNVILGKDNYAAASIAANCTFNRIEHNYIGLDASGSRALGGADFGVSVVGALENVVGPGNVISGHAQDGVLIYSPSGRTSIVGNRIGTDASGRNIIGNGSSGIEINGSYQTIVGGTNELSRNVISGNRLEGILILGPAADNSVIQGNFIGTDVTGTIPLGNGEAGIRISSANNTLIGGATPEARNIISANGQRGWPRDGRSGIEIWDNSSGNKVHGNFLGTDVTGSAALGNAEYGVLIFNSPNNEVGGLSRSAGNVISGNLGSGVAIEGSGSEGNFLSANLIGTDAAGMMALGNQGYGIQIVNAPGIIIGQSVDGGRNIIAANRLSGVLLDGSGTVNTRVRNSFIGLDITGTRGLGNGASGVHVRNGSISNALGGTLVQLRNVIAANVLHGIQFEHASTVRNQVQGNFIGTDVTGTNALGNWGSGVRSSRGASSNVIGSTLVGGRNTIAYNAGNGVFLRDGTQNLVRGNRIYRNGGLGINLGLDDVTLNDPGDSDGGANLQQNYPLLTSAIVNPNNTASVTGSIEAPPGSLITVELFANIECDPSGYGEGMAPLMTTNIVADASGQAVFVALITSNFAPGLYISATASAQTNNTSEFCPCVQVVPAGGGSDLALSLAAVPSHAIVGDRIVWQMTLSNAGPALASGAIASLVLPSGVGFLEASASQGVCALMGNLIRCDLGPVDVHQVVVASVAARPLAAGVLSAFASVVATEGDPVLANNSAMIVAEAHPAPRLTLSMSEGVAKLLWPRSGSEDFVLKATSSLVPPVVWVEVTQGIDPVAEHWRYTITPSQDNMFFRLVRE